MEDHQDIEGSEKSCSKENKGVDQLGSWSDAPGERCPVLSVHGLEREDFLHTNPWADLTQPALQDITWIKHLNTFEKGILRRGGLVVNPLERNEAYVESRLSDKMLIFKKYTQYF